MTDRPNGQPRPASDQPWRGRTKVFIDGRLVWFDQEPDEDFWYEHWRSQVDPDRYERLTRYDISRTPLGSVLTTWLPRTGKHLEAGCGPGYHLAGLRARGFDVEGIDSSARLVELVNTTAPDLPIRLADALAIDRPDGYYDGYISLGVIEHREEGPDPFLAEAARVLRPGGTAIIAVPCFGPLRRLKACGGCYRGPVGTRTFYQYAFGPRELRDLLSRHGLTTTKTSYWALDRLLTEEVRGWERVARLWSGRVARASQRVLRRWDGHMLTAVARKG